MANASWSKEEDEILTKIVTQHGAKDWTRVAMSLPGRIGKQCRERWHHHLNPEVVKKKWTLEEDLLILRLFMQYSSRWSEIAKHVPGRTDNQIKNRYNSNLKKRFDDKSFTKLLSNPVQSLKVPAAPGPPNPEASNDSITFDKHNGS